jgi:hypothetical protein
MLKKILNLEGIQELTKNEQKKVGGTYRCNCEGSFYGYCEDQSCCDRTCGVMIPIM